MQEIKQLKNPKELEAFIDILQNAYPQFNLATEADKIKFKEKLVRSKHEKFATDILGVYKNKMLVAGMRLFDFKCNFHSQLINVAGIGMIAVSLLNKKEKICRDIISHFLQKTYNNGHFMTALYPFNSGFYKKMGYGFGTTTRQFRLHPSSLIDRTDKSALKFITRKNKAAFLECYNKYFSGNHGLFNRSEFELNEIFNTHQVIGCFNKNRIEGYLIFSLAPNNLSKHDLHVIELIYNSKEALAQLVAFLRSQADQVASIIINTQEEALYYLSSNPSNGSQSHIRLHTPITVEETGLMYRVINTEKLFVALFKRKFAYAGKLRFCIHVIDDFFDQNNKPIYLNYQNGTLSFGPEKYDVKITIDISNFSSLIMGAISFNKLYAFGLLEISNAEYVNAFDAIFNSDKPQCVTKF